MKIKFLLTLSIFLSILLSTNVVNGCGGSCYRGCPSFAACEFDNKCQCTDPSCWRCYDRDCTSVTTCCEAFGNIGAR